jgi:predicted dithiol-disulfide oxidoreductase (DUF899 family)
MTDHQTGTREEWLAARADLLEREKELTRMGDELARQRRELPWVPVGKEYTLQSTDGPKTLAELLAYRERMGWSFNWASSYNSDFTFDFGVSSTEETTRGWAEPALEEGWMPPIASQNAAACGTDIISYLCEGFGVDVFARERDTVYHTYSSNGRGVEFLMGYYPILDRTPRGRDEGNAFQTWLRRRDEYSSK